MRDIIEVALELGLSLEPSGSEFKACCPHPQHRDTEPSLFISPAKQKWYCFGCSRGGSVLGLVRWLRPEWSSNQAAEVAWAENGPGELIIEELNRPRGQPDDEAAMLFAAMLQSLRGGTPPTRWLDALDAEDVLGALQTCLEED